MEAGVTICTTALDASVRQDTRAKPATNVSTSMNSSRKTFCKRVIALPVIQEVKCHC